MFTVFGFLTWHVADPQLVTLDILTLWHIAVNRLKMSPNTQTLSWCSLHWGGSIKVRGLVRLRLSPWDGSGWRWRCWVTVNSPQPSQHPIRPTNNSDTEHQTTGIKFLTIRQPWPQLTGHSLFVCSLCSLTDRNQQVRDVCCILTGGNASSQVMSKLQGYDQS